MQRDEKPAITAAEAQEIKEALLEAVRRTPLSGADAAAGLADDLIAAFRRLSTASKSSCS